MVALFTAMIVAGAVLLNVAAIWYVRTARERSLWRRSRRDAGKVAIVLELEDRVRQIDTMQRRDRS